MAIEGPHPDRLGRCTRVEVKAPVWPRVAMRVARRRRARWRRRVQIDIVGELRVSQHRPHLLSTVWVDIPSHVVVTNGDSLYLRRMTQFEERSTCVRLKL